MIRAGTTAKAILLSGADIAFESNVHTSTPVKLRILDDVKELKGAVLIGYALGDLSDSRMYIRLERLTLIEPNGDFVTVLVDGYVTGTDGKEGVEGYLVDNPSRRDKNFLPLIRVDPPNSVSIVFTNSPIPEF
jgi:conjugal transfer pilus assembly protein TraB